MKPPRFGYCAAGSGDEAVALLAEHGDDAKVLAGGQSLMPLLNMRLSQPSVLVDISRAADLQAVSGGTSQVRYGAGVVHRRFEDREVADPTRGLLTAAAAGIGYRAIRNRGTLGGSLAHADASAEWPVVMSAVDATVYARSARGERAIPARELVHGFFVSALDDDELITAVSVSAPTAPFSWGLYKATRKVGEFSESLGVAILQWEADRSVSHADIWLGAARDVPVRAVDLERQVVGTRRAPSVTEVAHAMADALGAPADAEERYRHNLHAVTLHRALTDAMTSRPE